MKIGVSSYSFSSLFANGTMTILDAIDWVAESQATHLEISIAGFGRDILTEPELVDEMRARATERGVTLSNYVTAADFRDDDLAGQIATVKAHLDVAHKLGIPYFRHDVVEWGWKSANQAEVEETMARIVAPTQEIADYAATLGITTSAENHGFFINNSERLRRLVHEVNRPNFKVTLDIGNFLCVDELPESSVPQTLPYASVVHLKDFYIRDFRPGDGWLNTLANNHIRGAIVGYGDIPMKRIIGIVKHAGFDGPISIEFEGLEDPRLGLEVGLKNATRIWDEV